MSVWFVRRRNLADERRTVLSSAARMRAITEQDLCEFFVGDLPLSFSTEMHRDEIRVEIEWIFFELFRGRDDRLEIMERDETLAVSIEQLKCETIQRVGCQKE